jgi:hypothetical protein
MGFSESRRQLPATGSDLVFVPLHPDLSRTVQHLRRGRRSQPACLNGIGERSRPRTPERRLELWAVNSAFASVGKECR